MTPWEIIQLALQNRKPPRRNKWLADQIGESVATVGNWKTRRVPASKYRAIGDALGLTVDQIEGLAPLPWDKPSAWPFPDGTLLGRVERLEHDQRVEIQAKIREMLSTFEREKEREPGGYKAQPAKSSRQA